MKCDGTREETRFRLSPKRTSPFKSAGASVQSTAGSRGVRNSGSNAGYTMFRGSVKGTGYPLHSPVSPALPIPCVTVCHHISTGVYPLYRKLCGYQGLSGQVRKISPSVGIRSPVPPARRQSLYQLRYPAAEMYVMIIKLVSQRHRAFYNCPNNHRKPSYVSRKCHSEAETGDVTSQ